MAARPRDTVLGRELQAADYRSFGEAYVLLKRTTTAFALECIGAARTAFDEALRVEREVRARERR